MPASLETLKSSGIQTIFLKALAFCRGLTAVLQAHFLCNEITENNSDHFSSHFFIFLPTFVHNWHCLFLA